MKRRARGSAYTRSGPASIPGLGLAWCVTLLILGLAAIAGTCAGPARAQCPTPYCPGGTAVRVYDGGTGAHDAFTARRNLGISLSLLGLRDSLSSIYYSAIQDPILRVKDSQFWVKDNVDTTKQFQFQASPITTGTVRTFNMPNANGTFPLLESANVFTTTQTVTTASDVVGLKINTQSGNSTHPIDIIDEFASDVFFVNSSGLVTATGIGLTDASGGVITIQPKSAISVSRTYRIDNSISALCDFVMTSGTQTIAGTKTFTGANVHSGANQIQGATLLFCDGTSSRVHWADQADNTKKIAVNASAVTTATTRSRNELNLTGSPVLVGDDPPAVAAGALGKVDLTAQTANITTTNLSSTPPAGTYLVEVYLMCTTAAGAAGTLTVTVGWTDNVGATTAQPIVAFPLTATGRATGYQFCKVSSGDITYAVAVTGIYSTAAYAVYVRVTAKG